MCLRIVKTVTHVHVGQSERSDQFVAHSTPADAIATLQCPPGQERGCIGCSHGGGMLLFDGEPVLFFLFVFSVLGLLVGGCLWGSGEDDLNHPKMVGGIVLFIIGCATTVVFLVVFTYKRVRRRKKKRREIEQILRFQESAMTEEPNPAPIQSKRHAYENRAAELKDSVTQF
ncbi:unnamed protein product [Dicrocoelium dendriticum]|nr:unnamed protein product [Dicrocoelium dendriticum]